MFTAMALGEHELPYLVQPVLLGHEPSGALGLDGPADQAVDRRGAVGDVQPGRLVVTLPAGRPPKAPAKSTARARRTK